MPKCRICKSPNLVDVISLGNQYLSEFRDDGKKPVRFPLDLVICNKCKQVQLKETVPQSLLYTDNYGYRSGINNAMVEHLQGIVEDLLHWMPLEKDDIVVDIGSNDGTLLKAYPYWLRRVGYDLVPKFAQDYLSHQIEFVNEPFSVKNSKGKAKVITAISMFYDLENPVEFISTLAQCLAKDGVIVIQQNYLLEMLRNNGFENVCHEHIMYHSLDSMERIVKTAGLTVFDVMLVELNGGSIRTYICKEGDYQVSPEVEELRKLEKDYRIRKLECYDFFAQRVNDTVAKLRRFIIDVNNQGKKVYLYGASTRINTLLQYAGLNNKLIQKAVERNPEKFGKTIASVDIPIISEEQMRKEKPDYLLLGPWFFRDYFIEREAQYLKEGGKIIVPLPNVEIISG